MLIMQSNKLLSSGTSLELATKYTKFLFSFDALVIAFLEISYPIILG